jgi:hypothetical protein
MSKKILFGFDQLLYIKVQNILGKNLVKIQSYETMCMIQKCVRHHAVMSGRINLAEFPKLSCHWTWKLVIISSLFGKRIPGDMSVSFSRSWFLSAASHFARNSFQKKRTWLLLDCLFWVATECQRRPALHLVLRRWVGGAFLSSINVFVVDLLERSGYFIYHEV